MASLLHTIKTKGVINTIKRMGMVTSRYSFNAFSKSIHTMVDVLEKYDAKVTFPITAITLERNIDLIKELDSKSIEWAMHGFVHLDYAKLDKDLIEEHIKKGKKIFNKANINVVGFRAPYLSSNNNLLSILSKNGFIYDSSKCYFVKVISSEINNVKIILDYYKPLEKWGIKKYNDILEIPICLPDDEILSDRLKYKDEKIGKIWIEMCQRLTKKKIIPILGLHPERGRICKTALDIVLNWARKNDVKSVCLKDIANNKNKKDMLIAITGDVDVIKISDFKHMKNG
jgi:uncharacterized protein YejL (UPF0352 family)